MSFTYVTRKRGEELPQHKEELTGQSPVPNELRSGAAAPVWEQSGHRPNLPEAMQARMVSAFGTGLSAAKLRGNDTGADTGNGGIAFAPGMQDFSGIRGRAGAMPTASLSPVSAASAAGPMQADKNDDYFPGGTASGMSADFGDAQAEEAEAAEAAAAESVGGGLQLDLDPGSGAGMTWDIPETGRRKAPAAKGKDEWGFTSRKGGAQFTGGAGFLLGMENADDPTHGAQFKEMLAALKPLAVARGNRQHMDGMAGNAIEGNAYDVAIAGMEAYRAQLKSERGNFRERHRQMKLLKQMIASARADKAATQAEQTADLGGGEFTGTIRSGAINQAYRYARGGEGGYFKPKTETSSSTEKEVMDRVGITPSSAEHDARLQNREIAFSRLGSLLGSSVTIGAKQAVLGFKASAGDSGVLMEEAKGKSWEHYNWLYPGLAPGQGGGDPNARDVLLDRETLTGSGHSVGERLAAAGGGLSKKSTRGPDFSSYRPEEGMLEDTGKQLDMSDPDYQRQMNEMFLLDTLAGHTDRHAGNFHVDRDEHDRISVKALDNDLTFGSMGSEEKDAAAFGKRGSSVNYGGLPAKMQIDAEMAQKIAGMKRETLDLTFSDLLDKKEIDSLWTRFQLMQKYIGSMDPDMLVEEWNEDTARREASLAGGVNSFVREGSDPDRPYTGNNYFQRQFLMLNAMGRGDRELYSGAIGHYKSTLR